MARNFIIGFLILVVGFVAWAAIFAWRSPPVLDSPADLQYLKAPRIPSPGTDALFHSFEIESGKGVMLMFGTTHTYDPEHPVIDEIDSAFRDFQPEILLIEGRLGFLLPGFMDPVRTYGEMGYAASLAKKNAVGIYSWEPSRAAEIATVIEILGKERAAAFFITRPILGPPPASEGDEPEVEALRLIKERGNWPGLEGAIPDLETLDRVWFEAVGPDGPDWRTADDRYGWPAPFDKAALESNHLRDDHLLRLTIAQVRDGKRVFVIAGSGHALKLEDTFRRELEPQTE